MLLEDHPILYSSQPFSIQIDHDWPCITRKELIKLNCVSFKSYRLIAYIKAQITVKEIA